MHVTVVIPHSGRTAHLIRCIKSLMEQNVSHQKYEVIVINDGAILPPKSIKNLKKCGVRVFVKPHTGVCSTRNLGIREARGTLIIFLDDDCVADRFLIEAYCAYFQLNTHIAGAGGTVKGISEKSPLAAYACYRRLLGAPILIGGKIDTLVTANCCFRREALLSVGGFDERFDRYFRSCGGEDADLSYTLRLAGFKLGYCFNAIALHEHRRTLVPFINQQIRNGKGVYFHARLRGRRLSEFGYPEPNLYSIAEHLSRYLIVSKKESPSLAKRIQTYLQDPMIPLLCKMLFPFIDLLRRVCYIWGIVRAHHQLYWRMEKYL